MFEATGRKLTAAVFAALLVALFALGGCGSSQPSSSAAASSSSQAASSSAASSTASSANVEIGEEAGSVASVTFVNETGADIGDVAIAPHGVEAEPVELMAASESWADGESAIVYFTPQDARTYDIQLGIGDATYTLHDFDAELIANASVYLTGDIAYVTYEQFGNEASTLEAETAVFEAQAAEAEAAAAEAEAAAAEAAAAEAAAAEAAYTYEQPAAPAAPAQSSDSCIDGGVVLR